MRFKIGIVLILFIALQCKKKSNYDQILVIGHAASGLSYLGTLAHDNSNEAVEWALSQYGVDGVELDVQTSIDSTAWLYHDEKLNTETNGDGCVFEKNDSYLEQLNYSSINKEKLVRLKNLKESYLNAKSILLDIRHYNYCQTKVSDLESVVHAVKQSENMLNADVIILLNNPDWISKFKQDGFTVLLAVYSIQEARQWFSKDVDGFLVKNDEFTINDISEIKSNGKKVFIFDIKSANSIREAFSKFPDGVISDDILRALTIQENG